MTNIPKNIILLVKNINNHTGQILVKTQLSAQAPERNHREVRLGVTIISETRSQRKPIKIVDFEIIWVCIITIILFMPSWPYGSSSLPWAIVVLICTVTNTHEHGMKHFFKLKFLCRIEKIIYFVRFFDLKKSRKEMNSGEAFS